MTEEISEPGNPAPPNARELLRLPLDQLNRQLREAIEEVRRAKRRERWLRAIRAMKIHRDRYARRGDR